MGFRGLAFPSRYPLPPVVASRGRCWWTIMEKTALVIGATGLVGAELVSQLLADGAYGRVIAFTRRDTGLEHDKLTTHIIDFDDRDAWAPLVRGHVLFSTLGTTAKVAGSKEAQFRIDHDYQLWFAEAARDNGVESLVLVSAMGADANSVVFYSRMKGQLERAVRALEIPRTVILQPGMLDGPRKEKRPAERLALGVMRNMPAWALPPAARPVHARIVAAAARAAACTGFGTATWRAKEIFRRGQQPA